MQCNVCGFLTAGQYCTSCGAAISTPPAGAAPPSSAATSRKVLYAVGAGLALGAAGLSASNKPKQPKAGPLLDLAERQDPLQATPELASDPETLDLLRRHSELQQQSTAVKMIGMWQQSQYQMLRATVKNI